MLLLRGESILYRCKIYGRLLYCIWKETKGLPDEVLNKNWSKTIKIPMKQGIKGH